MKIYIPTVDSVIAVNRLVCHEAGNTHFLRDRGRVESALSTTFFPGAHPFAHGGTAGLAGALAFYITQAHAFQDGNKRTAAVTAVTFMEFNGWDIKYVELGDRNDFADLILGIAASQISKYEAIKWFEDHKVSKPFLLRSHQVAYDSGPGKVPVPFSPRTVPTANVVQEAPPPKFPRNLDEFL